MIEEEKNELARLSTQATMSQYVCQHGDILGADERLINIQSANLYLTIYSEAKKMIDDMNNNNIKVTQEVKELSKAVASSVVRFGRRADSEEELRSKLHYFLDIYFMCLSIYSRTLKNTDYATDEMKKIAASLVQSTMSAHGPYWHIPLYEAAIDIYNYTLKKLVEEKNINEIQHETDERERIVNSLYGEPQEFRKHF